MSSTPRVEPEVEEAERTLKEMRGAGPIAGCCLSRWEDSELQLHLSFGSCLCAWDAITLMFSNGTQVLIEGRNLARARQQLRPDRADELRECRESELGDDVKRFSA